MIGSTYSKLLNHASQNALNTHPLESLQIESIVNSRSWPSSRKTSPLPHPLWDSFDNLHIDSIDSVSNDDDDYIFNIFSKQLSNHDASSSINANALDLACYSKKIPTHDSTWNNIPFEPKPRLPCLKNSEPFHSDCGYSAMNADYNIPAKNAQISRNETSAPPALPRTSSVTNVCHYFLQGYCARGNNCKFAHLINVNSSVPLIQQSVGNEKLAPRSAYNLSESMKIQKLATFPFQKPAAIDLNVFSNAKISDFVGSIYQLSQDQQGCRFLQKKLELGNPVDVNIIFTEVFSHFPELMMDPFGNYLCQKLLEYLSADQTTLIIDKISNSFVEICLNMHGTRAAQKLCESITLKSQIKIISAILNSNVTLLVKDLNGNHVIQKCLAYFEPSDKQFIYDNISKNCVEIATHRHGCCVIQRCIDHASEIQKRELVKGITVFALELVQNPYGNYVVQYILDLNDLIFTDGIIQMFLGNICELSVQKFSSNVIEKCIRVSMAETKYAIIEELINASRLESLLNDSFGNYVVQTSLDFSEKDQRVGFIKMLQPILPKIKNTPHGKRIYSKMVEY